jgi:hypothetical protein
MEILFEYPISNHPKSDKITRKLSFIRFQRFDLDGNRNVVPEFMIRHFSDEYELVKENKPIFFYIDDSGGFTNPIDLDIDADDNFTGLDSEKVNDIDFFINWNNNNKGLKRLFYISIIRYDQKIYDVNGVLCSTDNGLTPIYSLIDLKFFDIIK